MDYCHEFATCTNTGPGTSTCTCNKAYTGNGKNCTGLKIYNILHCQILIFCTFSRVENDVISLQSHRQ